MGRQIETNRQTYRKTERVRQKEGERADNKNPWQGRVVKILFFFSKILFFDGGAIAKVQVRRAGKLKFVKTNFLQIFKFNYFSHFKM